MSTGWFQPCSVALLQWRNELESALVSERYLARCQTGSPENKVMLSSGWSRYDADYAGACGFPKIRMCSLPPAD